MISLSGNKITNLAFSGRIMGGKVNVLFHNQYSSKLVLLGDIYLPTPLGGPKGPPGGRGGGPKGPPGVAGDIYPITARV